MQSIGESIQKKCKLAAAHGKIPLKRIVRWEYEDSDKAVQFSNLFSRLLTLPILNRKAELVHLLSQLSSSPSAEATKEFPQSPSPDMASNERMSVDRHTFHSPSAQTNSNGFRVKERPDLETGSRTSPAEGNTPMSNHFDASECPSESALLRDLPFTLQGFSSTHFQFSNETSIQLASNLPLPLMSLLHTLAEPSLLYRNLSEWVQSKDEGLIGQSLRAAVSVELRSYLGLIASLEGEIRRSQSSAAQSQARKTIVTLKRCVIWTRDATLGLRLMSLLAEESKSKKGGQLITLIHSFANSYGDPFVSTFAERLLVHLTRPFYNMLRRWIYDGDLLDPYLEFFVIKSPEDANPRSTSNVWENKYALERSLVPSIITDELAQKVFLIGKSLNFIRYSCSDSAWVEAYSKNASKELNYGDTAHLEASIDEAYKTTMARLTNLMVEKFKFFDHLEALKKYLLLGQGDFVALLMESLAVHLDRPAGSQYRHTLTAQLDHAIRGSNAQYDSSDVLRRLDARLLEMSHGEIGWDVFTLEYKVDAPVDVVITPWANKQYLTVFNFLWRIKRVEFALGLTWRRLMTGARGILASVSDKLGNDWKIARCAIAEMTHFINQLQYYILFEVIEASWDQLQLSIRKPDCTLDEIIVAHTQFLKSITHKGLLGASRSTITGTREESFMSQLHYILKTMLAFRDAVDGLYSFSVADSFRAQTGVSPAGAKGSHRQRIHSELDDMDTDSPMVGARHYSHKGERETDSPIFGAAARAGLSTTAESGADDAQMLMSLRKRLSELSIEFRTRLTGLLGDLLVQPDPDLKFLGVVMNFNEVYKPVMKRKRRRDGDSKAA